MKTDSTTPTFTPKSVPTTHRAITTGMRFSLMLVLLLGALSFGAATLSPAPVAADGLPGGVCNKFDGRHREIRRGSTGGAVRHAQCLLNVYGYNLDVDGDFGPHTEDAIEDFQAFNRLKDVDGIVGRCTWEALHSEAIPVECLDS